MLAKKLCAKLNHSRGITISSLWAGFVKPALARRESSTHWTKSVLKTRPLPCKQFSNSHLSLASYLMRVYYQTQGIAPAFGLKQISGLTTQYSICTPTVPTILAQAKSRCPGVKRQTNFWTNHAVFNLYPNCPNHIGAGKRPLPWC